MVLKTALRWRFDLLFGSFCNFTNWFCCLALFGFIGHNGRPVRVLHYEIPWNGTGKITHVWLDNTSPPCCHRRTAEFNWTFSPFCWERHDDWPEISFERQYSALLGCSSMSWCPYFSVCFDLVTSIQKFFSGSYPVSLICRYLELYYLGPSFLEYTSKRRISMICTMAYWVFNIDYDPINTLV